MTASEELFIRIDPKTVPDVYGVPGDSLVYGDGGRSITDSPPHPIDPLAPECAGEWSGKWNLFAGRRAGTSNTSGNMNTFTGSGAGDRNTIGDQLTSVGALAGQLGIDRYHCVDVGCGAAQEQIHGAFNVAVGTDCMLHSPGGENNTCVGCESGSLEGGIANSYFGAMAGMKSKSGVGCTYIGTLADGSWKDLQNAIAVGYQAQATKDNQAVFGGEKVTETVLRGNVHIPSLTLGTVPITTDGKNLFVVMQQKKYRIVLTPVSTPETQKQVNTNT